MNTRIQIDILGFDGCPNVPSTIELVESLVASEGADAKISLINVDSIEDAERLRFLGSPTVQVSGIDIEPSRQGEGQFSYSCRVYWTNDGGQGVPPESLIRDALREHLSR